MDLSVSNIIRILEQGLQRKAFLSDNVFRQSSPTLPFTIYEKLSLQAALRNKAMWIRDRIQNVKALTLYRDTNLYNGKQYFWLIFHDAATAYVLSRLLIDELNRAFDLNLSDRNSLIENFLATVRKEKPKVIIRTDIGSFFESIDHNRLFQILESNDSISALSIEIYRRIFAEFNRNRLLVNHQGKGLPRGLAVSSYLAEVFLQRIDAEIRRMSPVSFYGRYVDDIIITVNREYPKTSTDLFATLKETFAKSDLLLHEPNDGKTSLVDITQESKVIGEYLGYELSWNGVAQSVSVSMPEWKINNRRKMIDKAFLHFEKVSRISPQLARHELMSCLNYLSGNFRLSGSKKHIKAGIYYSNRHLTDLSGLDDLTGYLHLKPIVAHQKSFSIIKDMYCYTKRLKTRIQKIDFRKRWIERKTFSFSPVEVSRLKGIVKLD